MTVLECSVCCTWSLSIQALLFCCKRGGGGGGNCITIKSQKLCAVETEQAPSEIQPTTLTHDYTIIVLVHITPASSNPAAQS